MKKTMINTICNAVYMFALVFAVYGVFGMMIHGTQDVGQYLICEKTSIIACVAMFNAWVTEWLSTEFNAFGKD